MSEDSVDPDRKADPDADRAEETADAPDETADETTTNGDAAAADAPSTDEALAARVAAYDEELAADVESLQRRVSDLESELDASNEQVEDLSSRLKRTQADFQNYKKRAKNKQEQIRERATEDFVGRVVAVRDNLVRALEQDEDADIRPGVESTLEEFDRILSSENVATIDPEPGADVDPTRHEVMMRVDSDQPEGTVADVYQPGYEMAEKVIREAQVTVSTGDGDE
ncbi:molecular chaperone GrpE [Halopelagius inordinatus]|uniref:Protein GrpE n=1 Tax=Halopelagius inordinatus TaxID=553467 RepID=A0A1I2UMF7_9EURY|nr:nucleotide exchange factor GrpE [Halopelagius inordinatus]SFG78218.1 molecular chaperone GrpE [Halopelagius inordinatus]